MTEPLENLWTQVTLHFYLSYQDKYGEPPALLICHESFETAARKFVELRGLTFLSMGKLFLPKNRVIFLGPRGVISGVIML